MRNNILSIRNHNIGKLQRDSVFHPIKPEHFTNKSFAATQTSIATIKFKISSYPNKAKNISITSNF